MLEVEKEATNRPKSYQIPCSTDCSFMQCSAAEYINEFHRFCQRSCANVGVCLEQTGSVGYGQLESIQRLRQNKGVRYLPSRRRKQSHQ